MNATHPNPSQLKNRRLLLAGLAGDRVENHLLLALKEQPVYLHVIVEPDSDAHHLCKDHGIPYHVHRFRNRMEKQAVLLFRDLQAAHSFDIFHCLTNRALATGLLACRRMHPAPKVVAYRGTVGHLSWLDPASWLSYLNPRISRIVCVSDAVKRYLQSFRIPDSRLTVIWKGHDPSWYPRAADKPDWSTFDIPEDAVKVVFLGNIRPVKGVDVLLRSFDDITPADNIHLLVIGDVRDPAIIEQMDNHPCIHFTGFRRDAAKWAGACDIAVMPSIEREGLPKAIIESMAQGVPPIVTDVGGMPELIEHETCGLVIPPKDPAALRDAIRRLAGNPALREQYGRAAKARIEEPFNFNGTLEKTLALYKELLA